jgi:hypothetical protein
MATQHAEAGPSRLAMERPREQSVALAKQLDIELAAECQKLQRQIAEAQHQSVTGHVGARQSAMENVLFCQQQYNAVTADRRDLALAPDAMLRKRGYTHLPPYLPEHVVAAAENGDEASVSAFIDAGGDINSWSSASDEAWTLLMAACAHEQDALVSMLLARSPRPELDVHGGGSLLAPLMYAIGSVPIVQRLLRAGVPACRDRTRPRRLLGCPPSVEQ